MRTDIIILAAGQGSRMQSSMPKVLHPLAGKTMLEHVITAARRTQDNVGQGNIHVVIGHGAEQVQQRLADQPVHWVLQHEQLGTGHAVQQTLSGLSGADVVLVLYGDVPLIHPATLQSLVMVCHGERLALLTAKLPNPSGYGRIIRDSMGNIASIIEDKDALSEQLAINEVNTGIMAVPGSRIAAWVDRLDNCNAQREYYLTAIVAFAAEENIPVVNTQPRQLTEVQGVNSRTQLVMLERQYQRQQAEQLMANGVTVIDPERIDLRGTVTTGCDVTLDINVVLAGQVVLGNNVYIEPGCIIHHATIADNTVIRAHSVVEQATVANGCIIGPFARLRPGTVLSDQVRIGNFVEIKNTTVGASSKVNHLAYLGDTEVGAQVNVGAGAVTCNYDGVNKHRTVIGDRAFIGTNSALVAPVTVGTEATVAAGSAITLDVPDGQLAVARSRQRNVDGWCRPGKKS